MTEDEDIVTQMKSAIAVQEGLIATIKEFYDEDKQSVARAEERLQHCNRLKNAHYKNWVEARKKLKRMKARLSALPSKGRKYTKEHLGEILEKMDECPQG